MRFDCKDRLDAATLQPDTVSYNGISTSMDWLEQMRGMHLNLFNPAPNVPKTNPKPRNLS